jgi:hypothetical protein
VNATPRLQFHIAGTQYHPNGGLWSKTKYEAEASRPPFRYRIWHASSWRGGYYSVVRLKPSIGTSKLTKSPLKFSGYSLRTVVCTIEEAVAIAEADNARLVNEGTP